MFRLPPLPRKEASQPPTPPPEESFDEDPPFGPDDLEPPDEDFPDDDEMGDPDNDFDPDDLPPESELDFPFDEPPPDFDEDLPDPEGSLSEPPPSSTGSQSGYPPPQTVADNRLSTRSAFSLPVRAVSSKAAARSEDTPSLFSMQSGPDEMLTSGLMVKEAPKLFRPQPPPPPPTAAKAAAGPNVNFGVDTETNSNRLHTDDYESNLTTKLSSHHNEYAIPCLGRFEGDPFEELRVSVQDKILVVNVATSDEDLDFDLSSRAQVYEDTAEPLTIALDYRKTVLVFKFFDEANYVQFMKSLPVEVFITAPPEQDDDEETEDTTTATSAAKAKGSAMNNKKKKTSTLTTATTTNNTTAASKPRVEHVHGTSVEDLLESDFESSSQRQERLDQMFNTNKDHNNSSQLTVPPPARKRELIDSYIRKPRYSVRRVALLCGWINSLRIWPNEITILTLHREICSGVLLARIVKELNPEVQFLHLHEKALAKKAAIENLEQALGHIWRSKSLNNSRIPTAAEIYGGDASKTAILLNELFGAYIQKPLFKNATKMLRWYNAVLKQYQRSLPNYVLEDGDLAGVWPHFQSGTALFCILYHFFGTTTVGNTQRLDPLRISGAPASICDFRDNLLYVFDLLRLLGVYVMWSPEDWITNPDTEFVLLQLHFIYEKLRLLQCALPPAQGDRPGLASGPNGEAIVVGLVFSDAPAKLKFIPKTRKAVRLGYDQDSMPLLPVDRIIVNPRFTSHGYLPRGMLSKDVTIGQVEANLKETRIHIDRGHWNAHTAVKTEKEQIAGAHLVQILRDHHRSGGDSASDGYSSNAGASRLTDSSRLSPTTKGGNNNNNKAQFVSNTIGELTGGIGSPTKPPTSCGKNELEENAKEIASLIKALEDEMNIAQQEIKSVEESLASRYMDLENVSRNISAQHYATQLEILENEREDLESEKLRLKEYFARKLALIKARKEEQNRRTMEMKKAETNKLANTNNKNAQLKRAQSSSKLPSGAQNVKQAEKGWIKLSSKMDTHNFHLRTKQEASSALFKAKITPKHLLERQSSARSMTAGSNNNDTTMLSRSTNDLHQLAASTLTGGPESVDTSFAQFKLRLNAASERWKSSRVQKSRSIVQDILSSGNKATTVELISVPDRAAETAQQHRKIQADENINLAYQVRQEEFAAMRFEDERQRMVLMDTRLKQSQQLTRGLFSDEVADTSAAVAASSPSSRAGAGSGKEDMFSPPPRTPSKQEMNQLLSLLMTPKVITLVDRIPKDFVFELIEIDPAANNSTSATFALAWREVQKEGFTSGMESFSGYALLADITQVYVPVTAAGEGNQDTRSFIVALREAARAVKHAKGRTALTLRFGNTNECGRYFQALNGVLAALE